jgi:hypothetical protein
MKMRLFSVATFALALAVAQAQDANPVAAGGGSHGQRGGMGMMGPGRNVMGAVTEVAADHYTVKTYTGEIYTVHFSANTRILKQGAGMRGGQGTSRGDATGNPPQALKATDIKVGDDVTAMGEVDAAAKTVGAVVIVQVDPERARQMREMQANYGKTWIMGKVTAIDGVKVTLHGSVDNAAHSFVADENTTFRKRRDPITLADIQVGDMLRAEGALKGGVFTATTVSVMGVPPGGPANVPHNGPLQ